MVLLATLKSTPTKTENLLQPCLWPGIRDTLCGPAAGIAARKSANATEAIPIRSTERGFMATSPSSAAQTAENRPLSIMFAAALAAFIATFNETFLNVGFTNIMADFNIGVSTVQWLATAYMLGAAVMTPTTGFVSDGDVLDVIGDSVPALTTPYALLAHNDSTEFGTDVTVVLDRPIVSIATKSVITVNVNNDLGHISSVLADKHLKKALVVADDGTVVGIINRSDSNRYLVSTFVDPVPSA